MFSATSFAKQWPRAVLILLTEPEEDLAVHAFNPGTGEGEAGESL